MNNYVLSVSQTAFTHAVNKHVSFTAMMLQHKNQHMLNQKHRITVEARYASSRQHRIRDGILKSETGMLNATRGKSNIDMK